MEITTKYALEQTALEYGILPFFSNNIPGYSVEEIAGWDMMFNEQTDGNCWEWKGPVIQEMTLAYGKFLRKKAAFISRKLYPDFINWRRNVCSIDNDCAERMILNIIRKKESVTSAELRKIIFGSPKSRQKSTTFPDAMEYKKPGRHILEPALQRLQMGGWLLIANFQYKYSKTGERYGWGEALYTTPEIWFGPKITNCQHTPEASYQLLFNHIRTKLPYANEKEITKLLKP